MERQSRNNHASEYVPLAEVLHASIYLAGCNPLGPVNRGEIILRASLSQDTPPIRKNSGRVYYKVGNKTVHVSLDVGCLSDRTTILCLPLQAEITSYPRPSVPEKSKGWSWNQLLKLSEGSTAAAIITSTEFWNPRRNWSKNSDQRSKLGLPILGNTWECGRRFAMALLSSFPDLGLMALQGLKNVFNSNGA